MPITWWGQLIWLLALALVSFLVTWICADLLRLRQAPFIGVLAVVTGAFLYGYLSWSNADWVEFLSHQWLWGLVGAVGVGPVLIALFMRSRRSSQLRGRRGAALRVPSCGRAWCTAWRRASCSRCCRSS